jgi:hypothetical protein
MAVGVTGIFGQQPTHLASEIWNGRSWHGLVTPAPPQAFGQLALSCASRTSCMATGSARKAGTSYPFAESWNGRAWTTLAMAPPQNTMSGISCAAPVLCMAVGHTGPVAERSPSPAAELWNGSTWSALSMPAVPGAQSASLLAVSCASGTSCTAVGFYVSTALSNPTLTLAEQWNGTSWQVLTTPSPGTTASLTGISCASASSCVAVGGSDLNLGTPLIERWDGQSWSVQTAAIPAGAQQSSLDGVSCGSATTCMAVGSYEAASTAQLRVVTEQWDGTAWRLRTAPSPAPFPDDNLLGSVSCAVADGCMAVGSAGSDSLATQWDGHRWQVRRSGKIDILAGVSCTSAASCMAVGGYVSRTDRGVTVAEAWNGRRWLRRGTPTPAPSDALFDVSCTRPSFCMAVGSGNENTFAERWNGTRWTAAGAPPVSGPGGVSCASARRCIAVGGSRAAAWNGTRWRLVPTARIRGSVFIDLSDISCPAVTRCIAVGTQESRGAHALQTLAEEWNGRRWRFLATPDLGVLAAIDCPESSDCMAVGYSFSGRFSPHIRNLAEQWNGRTWRTLNPPGPTGSSLAGVSCPSAARCIAVGRTLTRFSSFEVGLAERWNGRQWRRVTPAGLHVALLSVSCARPSRCIAVGRAGTLSRAELWNGSRWRLLQTSNP